MKLTDEQMTVVCRKLNHLYFLSELFEESLTLSDRLRGAVRNEIIESLEYLLGFLNELEKL